MVPEIPLKICNLQNNQAGSLVFFFIWIRIDHILWIRIHITAASKLGRGHMWNQNLKLTTHLYYHVFCLIFWIINLSINTLNNKNYY